MAAENERCTGPLEPGRVDSGGTDASGFPHMLFLRFGRKRTVDPVRSSLGGGIAATIVLLLFLLAADVVLGGTDLFVYATFTSLCSVG